MTTSLKNTIINVIIVILALLILISSAVLFMQIFPFSDAPVQKVISLTGQNEARQNGKRAMIAPVPVPTGSSAMAGALPTASAGSERTRRSGSYRSGSVLSFISADHIGESTNFITEDDDQVWTTSTDIEIFHVRYDNNGDLVFTVNSSNKDKLIAPGTENTYVYRVLNEESRALQYTMTVEAYVTGTDLWIPVEAKLYDKDGNYLAGASDAWVDVLELDGIEKTATLGAGKHTDYVLDWRWPFERTDGSGLEANDAYDTMLGNLAVDDDLTLHIIIRTLAQIDDEPEEDGPHTGDQYHPTLYITGMTVSSVLLVLLLIRKKRYDEEE